MNGDGLLILTSEIEEPPPPLIPLAGNFITFPTTADPVDQIAVGWVQNKTVQTATYYQLRCWFGVEDTSGAKPKFETYGTDFSISHPLTSSD